MNDLSSVDTSNLGVVVGFDGSSHSVNALYWGAQIASGRNMPLTVASAYIFPHSDLMHSASQRLAEGQVERAQEILEEQHYAGETNYHALVGDAASWLVRLSADAELIVIGKRGLSKFWGQALGSVASNLPAHAQCPTVVVHTSETSIEDSTPPPHDASDTRPICVGLDDSDHARHAAKTAALEAKRHGVKLNVVQAQPSFTDASSRWYLHTDEHGDHRVNDEMLEFLNAEIEILQRQVPGVEMTPVVKRGLPAETMVECTEQSQLTVLGTRGRGGFKSLLLGSVSRATLLNARGTVMVVPLPKD